MATWTQIDSVGRNYTLLLDVTETGTSENSSTVSYTLQLSCQGIRYSEFNTGFTVTIDGNVVASQPRDWEHQTGFEEHYSTITLATGSITVEHNADGTKTILCSADLDISSDSPGPGPISISDKSLTLTNLIALSTFEVDPVAILGQPCHFAITKGKPEYTHTLTYSIRGASGTILTKSSATTATWTPLTSLGSRFSDAIKTGVTYRLETYQGNDKLGEVVMGGALQVPLPLEAPLFNPIVSIDNSAIPGNVQWDVGLKGYSKLVWDSGAYGRYGATIEFAKFYIPGQSFEGISGTTPTIQTAIDAKYPSFLATDSRGITGSQAHNSRITILDYKYPEIRSGIAYRANGSGTKDGSGEYLYINLRGSYDSLGGRNSMTVWDRYRIKDGTWGNWRERTDNVSTLDSGISPQHAYEVELWVEDAIGNHRELYIQVPPADIAFYFSREAEMAGMFAYGTKPHTLEIHGGLHAQYVYGTQLTNGTDLNTLTQTGRYYSSSSDNRFQHTPLQTNGAFDLYVLPLMMNDGAIDGNWKYSVQVYIPFGNDDMYVRRVSTNGSGTATFYDWREYGYSSNLTPLTVGASQAGVSFEVSRADHSHALYTESGSKTVTTTTSLSKLATVTVPKGKILFSAELTWSHSAPQKISLGNDGWLCFANCVALPDIQTSNLSCSCIIDVNSDSMQDIEIYGSSASEAQNVVKWTWVKIA